MYLCLKCACFIQTNQQHGTQKFFSARGKLIDRTGSKFIYERSSHMSIESSLRNKTIKNK